MTGGVHWLIETREWNVESVGIEDKFNSLSFC